MLEIRRDKGMSLRPIVGPKERARGVSSWGEGRGPHSLFLLTCPKTTSLWNSWPFFKENPSRPIWVWAKHWPVWRNRPPVYLWMAWSNPLDARGQAPQAPQHWSPRQVLAGQCQFLRSKKHVDKTQPMQGLSFRVFPSEWIWHVMYEFSDQPTSGSLHFQQKSKGSVRTGWRIHGNASSFPF